MIVCFLEVEYGGRWEREGLGEEGMVEAIFFGSQARDEEHNFFTSVSVFVFKLLLYDNKLHVFLFFLYYCSIGLIQFYWAYIVLCMYVSPAHLN